MNADDKTENNFKAELEGFRIATYGSSVCLSWESGTAIIQQLFTADLARKIGYEMVKAANWLDAHPS